jgi:DNA-binding LacI/PurR family transcriptional regulator
VAEHLLSLGRRRIAFLAGLENTSSSRDREIGLRSGLAQAGVALHARDVGNYVYRDALDATQRLLSRNPRPDALFCANDAMALAAVDVARNRKIKVPEELAIVGFDNTPPASSRAYSLTSVDQNTDQMVDQAIAMILPGNQLPGRRAQKIFVACRLEIRDTTGGGEDRRSPKIDRPSAVRSL